MPLHVTMASRKVVSKIRILILISFLISCTSLDSYGKKTRFSHIKVETEGCKYIGDVKAYPPFIGVNDAKYKLQNEAGRLGADLVYGDLFQLFVFKGKAFICNNTDRDKHEKETLEFLK